MLISNDIKSRSDWFIVDAIYTANNALLKEVVVDYSNIDGTFPKLDRATIIHQLIESSKDAFYGIVINSDCVLDDEQHALVRGYFDLVFPADAVEEAYLEIMKWVRRHRANQENCLSQILSVVPMGESGLKALRENTLLG